MHWLYFGPGAVWKQFPADIQQTLEYALMESETQCAVQLNGMECGGGSGAQSDTTRPRVLQCAASGAVLLAPSGSPVAFIMSGRGSHAFSEKENSAQQFESRNAQLLYRSRRVVSQTPVVRAHQTNPRSGRQPERRIRKTF